MQSFWSNREAEAIVAHYADEGVGRDLALCVYSSRLLGQDPKLVLHGGGNASLKTVMRDVVNDEVEVLCVKGSGWDMGVIEPKGLPAVRLAPLRRLAELDSLGDDGMVNALRCNLLDCNSPSPSVETFLHAFLPPKYIDHTHASSVLSITCQFNGDELCRGIYGKHMGIVPYVMPGFALAKRAAEVYETDPEVEGLILLKHGIVTFGETAETAYERMIDMVTLAEEHLRKGRNHIFVAAPLAKKVAPVAEVAPIVRGACSMGVDEVEGAFKRMILDFRSGPAILNFVNGKELGRYSQAGVGTPDHIIHTKNKPLILAAPEEGNLDQFKETTLEAVSAYIAEYRAYFARNYSRQLTPEVELDPLPRVVLVPGLGLFGMGSGAKGAMIAADIAENTVEIVTWGEAIGTFEPLAEEDLFDFEYWSLERAKLGKETVKPLTGQVTVVTGGAGVIGTAIATIFAREGCEVAILDLDGDAASRVAKEIGGATLALACDVTSSQEVRAAFDKVCETFGGVDIVVSNAGAAWQGKIGELSGEVLRKSFEINFFAHQTVAQTALRVMRAQGTGGALLFNVSKQAVNPGRDFGAYGLPKAALLLLVRQYALDHGGEGIRANAVNADRIRSGLLTDEMIAERSKARGLSEKEYMAGNLLCREVTAEDVAQAFLHHALALKTTADVTTVDGGNIAAVLR